VSYWLELGALQPPPECLILAKVPVLIDQQTQAFQETQLASRRACSCVFSDSAMPWSRMASSFSIIGYLSIAVSP
jgi:hypothetical protein